MNQFTRNSFPILISCTLLIACNNSTGNAGPAGDAVSGDADFSAVIDGQAITGKGIDGLQLLNTAFIYPTKDNSSKYILFDLMSLKQGDDFYTFRVYCPDKEGAFTVEDAKKNGYRYSVRMDFNLRSKDNFAIYTGDLVTVTIQSLSSSRITGTFSGDFKLSNDSRSKPYKTPISVTNGKFDIPFSTGNLRPE